MTASTISAPDAATAEEPPKKGRKKLLLVVLVLVLGAAAGAYFFLLRPGGDQAPKPGQVAPLDSIQINLADGHYLRLGIALQLTESATEVDGSKALDAAIEVFSGRSIGDIDNGATREKLRDQLEKKLEERYPDEVMGVYFTEYVTQ
ncbi:flagellar basal body-associated FliL family protein [Nocardioides panacisoli]|uniref:Flagellar protein FliL n=1 Tax=Nocardioides panacisoli TaxID=627624 RepID=A0ABP7HTU7_9ACTN